MTSLNQRQDCTRSFQCPLLLFSCKAMRPQLGPFATCICDAKEPQDAVTTAAYVSENTLPGNVVIIFSVISRFLLFRSSESLFFSLTTEDWSKLLKLPAHSCTLQGRSYSAWHARSRSISLISISVYPRASCDLPPNKANGHSSWFIQRDGSHSIFSIFISVFRTPALVFLFSLKLKVQERASLSSTAGGGGLWGGGCMARWDWWWWGGGQGALDEGRREWIGSGTGSLHSIY